MDSPDRDRLDWPTVHSVGRTLHSIMRAIVWGSWVLYCSVLLLTAGQSTDQQGVGQCIDDLAGRLAHPDAAQL